MSIENHTDELMETIDSKVKLVRPNDVVQVLLMGDSADHVKDQLARQVFSLRKARSVRELKGIVPLKTPIDSLLNELHAFNTQVVEYRQSRQ